VVSSVHSLAEVDVASGGALVRTYWGWLDKAWSPFVSVEVDSDEVCIRVLGVTAIRMESAGPSRFKVCGGALAHPGGVFAFDVGADGVEIALMDFVPRLPLWLYRLTHGPLHEWSMRRFERYLQDAS
jgi:hypothetical protein